MKEYLVEIYKVEADKYKGTREIHWKMNTALWTALVVALYAKYHSEISIDVLPFWGKLVVIVLMAGAHLAFIIEIHKSMARSLSRMNEMAIHLLENNSETPIKWSEIGTKTKLKNSNWKVLQISITLLLLGILFFVKKI